MRLTIQKDFYSGIILVLLGGVATAIAKTYKIGTLGNMGSGFFPASVGILLMFVGTLIAIGSFTKEKKADGLGARMNITGVPDLRGTICIVAGIITFIVLGTYGGLVPATFFSVFISSMGDRSSTIISALTLSLVITVIGVSVFSWALALPFPLFQWN
jgi:hypothetical protein